MVKIYIVNLRFSTARRKFMEGQLNKFNLPFEFVDAVDASALSADFIDGVNASRTYRDILTPGEIACSLSHIKAIKTAADEQSNKLIVIMEDDVLLGRYFEEVLSRISDSIKSNEIITLCNLVFQPVNLRHSEAIDSNFSLYLAETYENLFGAQVYCLSSSLALSLYKNLSPVKSVADDWFYFLSAQYVSAIRVCFPFPAIHAEFISDIHPDSVGKVSIRTKIKRYFYDRKIFPLYHIFLAYRQLRAEARQYKNIRTVGVAVKKTYRV